MNPSGPDRMEQGPSGSGPSSAHGHMNQGHGPSGGMFQGPNRDSHMGRSPQGFMNRGPSPHMNQAGPNNFRGGPNGPMPSQGGPPDPAEDFTSEELKSLLDNFSSLQKE